MSWITNVLLSIADSWVVNIITLSPQLYAQAVYTTCLLNEQLRDATLAQRMRLQHLVYVVYGVLSHQLLALESTITHKI